MNKRAVGAMYEEQVCRFLEENGLHILKQNFRGRGGEIDIIARDGAYFVFAEVKYRRSAATGYGEEAVGYAKQKTICRISDLYRMKNGLALSTPVRYDVISCTHAPDGSLEITWYKNAFPYHVK